MSQVFVRRCDRCMGVAETLADEPVPPTAGTPTVAPTVAPTDGASQPAFSYTLRGKGTTNVQDLCAACLDEIESLLAPGGKAAAKPRRGRPRGVSATAASTNGKRRGRPPGSKNKKRGRPPGSGKKRGRPRKIEAHA